MAEIKVDRPRTRAEARTLFLRAKRWNHETAFSTHTKHALEGMLFDAKWKKNVVSAGESWCHKRINGYWSLRQAVALTAASLAGEVRDAMIKEPLCAPLPIKPEQLSLGGVL